MSTRLLTLSPLLPHFAQINSANPRLAAINPLVTYVRQHQEAADAFLHRRFLTRRVTVLGETHLDIVGGFAENVCVRLFLRDMVRRLYKDARAKLAFLALEIDEARVEKEVGPLAKTQFPAGTVNKKAYWFSKYVSKSAAWSTALDTISRECDESRLTVVGIDDRTALPANINYFDLAEDPELKKKLAQREAGILKNFETKVLKPLGENRALVYFGAEHAREAPVEGKSGLLTFIEQLAKAGTLKEDQVFSALTTYAGTGFGISAQEVDPKTDAEAVILGVYDLLRAEFPSVMSLGFDIDDVDKAKVALPNESQYRLAKAYDGYLFFRDFTSWDGTAKLAQPPKGAPPEPRLRVTTVFPSTAPPKNKVFVYGHGFPKDVTVELGGQATKPRWINENVVEVEVPAGAGTADVAATRTEKVELGGGDSISAPSTFTLKGGFVYSKP